MSTGFYYDFLKCLLRYWGRCGFWQKEACPGGRLSLGVLLRAGLYVGRDGWARGKGVEFAGFLSDPPCAPEGGPAAKLTGCSDDQPAQTALLSGCWRQPSSPLLRLHGSGETRRSFKTFLPGPIQPFSTRRTDISRLAKRAAAPRAGCPLAVSSFPHACATYNSDGG